MEQCSGQLPEVSFPSSLAGEVLENWSAQPICHPEGFQLTIADGTTFFMSGSSDTRGSWHDGAVAGGGGGGDMPLGTSGRILRPGLWAAQVPWGGGQCQLLAELDGSVSAEVPTPYIRIHPLACDPSVQASARRGKSWRKNQGKAAAGKSGRHPPPSPVEEGAQAMPRRRAAAALNISGLVNVAGASPLFDFTIGGSVIASYSRVSVPAAPGAQFWLIQPVQDVYLGEFHAQLELA